MRKRGLKAFLLIAFGLAWGWELLAHLVLGWSLANPLVQVPAGFAPALAAFVVRRWVTREGFADAGSGLRLRAARRFYLIAWLGPLGVAAVVVGLAAAVGLPVTLRVDASESVPIWALPLLLCALSLVTTVAFWGEEFGWTAYLLLRVCPGQPRRAALAAGLIAAVWHWPLAFLGYSDFRNIPLSILGWTLWIVCQEFILAWLRARSGSIWPACLAHAGNNMVLVPLATTLIVDVSADALQWLVVPVLAALALWPFLRAHRVTAVDAGPLR